MDILERAKDYANGKAIDALTMAIEQAYSDGYNDGLKHLENLKLEALKEGVEYKDLGLKSGTLWSSKYVEINKNGSNKMPFLEAAKLNIPTKKQFEELCLECQLNFHNTTKGRYIKFTGITGESITIDFTDVEGIIEDFKYGESFFFWLQDDDDSKEKECATIAIKDQKWIGKTIKVFMGLKLPVMLVK